MSELQSPLVELSTYRHTDSPSTINTLSIHQMLINVLT